MNKRAARAELEAPVVDLPGLAAEIAYAACELRARLRPTPLVRADALSAEAGAAVLLKLETLQPTRSFKVRGAITKLLRLGAAARARGVVTASTGNHGLATAHAAKLLDAPLTVFLPEAADDGRVQALRALGAQVVVGGADVTAAAALARRAAAERGSASPYNDADVIAGQGTLAVELVESLDHFDNVFVALGGGGLVSGVGAYLKARRPKVRVFGCSAANSAALAACLAAGRHVPAPHAPTVAGALAGSIEPETVTLPIARAVVDRSIVCGEAEIEAALVDLVARERLLVEGAAAVTLAAYRQVQVELVGQTSVLVLCGANIEPAALARILSTGDAREAANA